MCSLYHSFIKNAMFIWRLNNLAEGQIEKFLAELNGKIELIEDLPRLYPVRLDFDFCGKEYRSFTAHWFTVFYRYFEEKDNIQILFIRPSASDFSNLSSF